MFGSSQTATAEKAEGWFRWRKGQSRRLRDFALAPGCAAELGRNDDQAANPACDAASRSGSTRDRTGTAECIAFHGFLTVRWTCSEPSEPTRRCGRASRLTVAMTMDYAEPAVPLSEGRMPLLGFGTWQISDAEAPAATACRSGGWLSPHRHGDRLRERGGHRPGAADRESSAGLGVPDHEDASGQRRSGTADVGGEPDQAGRGLRGPVARALAAESAGHAAGVGRVHPGARGWTGAVDRSQQLLPGPD